tara:strand:+ start:14082 stop:14984 length:903 start_codon:yes stop_codon:yes gene_type:complete
MIYEYALEPEALSDWQTARYLLDQFGVPHGRLVSQFPKSWKRCAYDACSGCSPIDKKRIEELLSKVGPKLIRTGREYGSSDTWVANALRSHREHPFRAILGRRESVSPGIQDAAEVGPETPGWIPDGGPIPRTPDAITLAARFLMSGAKKIRLIDPRYSCAQRHNGPLKDIVDLVRSETSANVIEYHVLANGTSEWFQGKLEGQDLHRVRTALRDREIHFYRWKPIEGGEAFHARYILTDRGGLEYDYGLDSGSPGQTTNVHRMPDSLHRQRWKLFDHDSQEFVLQEVFRLTSNSVSKIS